MCFIAYSGIVYALLLRNTTFAVLPTTQYVVLNLTVKLIGATQPNTTTRLVKYDAYITRKIFLYTSKSV